MKIVKNKFINEELDNKTIIVAVSTGVDSMILLHHLMKTSLNIIVVHINHQMREQSKKEEKFISDFCLQNNLKIEIFQFSYQSGNFQNEARKFRYEVLKNTCKKYKTNYIFLGHHKNDVQETILFKLLRGENLKTIDCLNYTEIQGDFILKRPLINYSKKEIYEYAKNNKILFFEDQSNTDIKYQRNKIRQFLEDENQLIKIKNEVIELNDYFTRTISNLNIINNNEIKVIEFQKQDIFIQKKIIELFFKENNVKHLMSKKSIEKYCQLLNENKTFKEEHNKTVVECQYGVFTIFTYVEDFDFEFKDKLIINNHQFEFCNNGNIIITKEQLPLRIRNYKQNDIIEFDYGHKKLNKFFIDQKIKSKERQSLPILVDKFNNIIFIPKIKKTKYCKFCYQLGDIVVKYTSI